MKHFIGQVEEEESTPARGHDESVNGAHLLWRCWYVKVST